MSADDQNEREANYFAMCLLMPEEMVRREVTRRGGTIDLLDGRKIKALADLFRVDPQLMTIRLMQIFRDAKPI